MVKLRDRNLAIFKLREEGLTFKKIGEKYELTVSRIKEICDFHSTEQKFEKEAKIRIKKNPASITLLDNFRFTLSVRAWNLAMCLKIKDLKDFRSFSKISLARVKNVGPKTVQEIEDILKRFKIDLKN